MNKIFLIITAALFCSTISSNERQIVRLTLYKLPLYKLYYNSLTSTDAIELASINRNDTSVIEITDSAKLVDALNILANSKCLKGVFSGNVNCKKQNSSMDIRHVFVIEYSDSLCMIIGLSSAENFMMVNESVFKRDFVAVKSLYRLFEE